MTHFPPLHGTFCVAVLPSGPFVFKYCGFFLKLILNFGSISDAAAISLFVMHTHLTFWGRTIVGTSTSRTPLYDFFHGLVWKTAFKHPSASVGQTMSLRIRLMTSITNQITGNQKSGNFINTPCSEKLINTEKLLKSRSSLKSRSLKSISKCILIWNWQWKFYFHWSRRFTFKFFIRNEWPLVFSIFCNFYNTWSMFFDKSLFQRIIRIHGPTKALWNESHLIFE